MDETGETCSASELRIVKTLLWEHLSSQLKAAEREEVKRTLGWSLITDNGALFAEAEALADILGTVQLSTTAVLQRQRLCSNPNRSMVEAEVRLLIDRLREVAGTAPFDGSAVKGRNPDTVIPRASHNEKSMADYISTVAVAVLAPDLQQRPRTPLVSSGATAFSSRPGSAFSRPPSSCAAAGLSRPGTASSRPSTASSGGGSGSGRSDPRSVVRSVNGHLNVSDIGAVKELLCRELQEERGALMEDIEYLQGLLEDETDLQGKASQPAPSVQDLKEYGHKLRTAVEAEEQRVSHELRVSKMFSAAEGEQGRAGRLRGMVSASRGDEQVAAPPVSSSAGTADAALHRSSSSQRHLAAPSSPSLMARASSSSSTLAPPRPLDAESRGDSRPRSGSNASHGLPSAPKPHGLPLAVQGRREGGPSEQQPSSCSPSRCPTIGGTALRSHGLPTASALQPVPHSTSGGSLSNSRRGVSLAPLGSPAPLPSSGALSVGDGSKSAAASDHRITSSASGRLGSAASSPAEAQPQSASSSGSAGAPPRPLPSSGGKAAGVRLGSGGPVNLVDALEAEVDSVLKGGVAAILAKHKYRPSSAISGPRIEGDGS